MSTNAALIKKLYETPGYPTLIARNGVGYEWGDPTVGALLPTPESWFQPFNYDRDYVPLTKTQKKAIRHRVTVRTVIEERLCMLEHRKKALSL